MVVPSGEKAGSIAWSTSGIGIMRSIPPLSALRSSSMRPRSCRANTATRSPSGENARSRPRSGPTVSIWAIRYW